MRKIYAATLAGLMAVSYTSQAQEGSRTVPTVGIKTNFLYDATATINLGAEFRLSDRVSLDIPFNYNGWTFDNNRKWKHFLVQPEARWWTRETFRGSFFGLHGHYALYNVGALPSPPFTEYMAQHRFEGWLAGAGVSYGYRWNFSPRWGMEATVGVGYAYLSYDKFPCYNCGRKIGSETKHYFGPTKAGLSLIFNIGGKKKPSPQPVPVYIPPVQPEPEPKTESKAPYVPRFEVSYLTPEAEEVKRRNERGRAYIDYAVGKSNIDPALHDNAAELQQIYYLIEKLQNDSDATITGIAITGHASPDGGYKTNLTISERRALALADHLEGKYGFAKDMFRTEGGGEDWQTLETLVEASAIKDREQILAIIRGTDILDGREKKLMNLSGGVPYREMLKEMFPKLRRSDYELNYTVLPFTVEKGKEVIKTDPRKLSLNEMFLIAQTYPAGSAAWCETFHTAAAIFPDSDVANLNAAACALARKDAASALGFLSKVSPQGRSAAYHNNMGVCYGLLGQWDKAAEAFALASGDPHAQHNAGETEKAKP